MHTGVSDVVTVADDVNPVTAGGEAICRVAQAVSDSSDRERGGSYGTDFWREENG